LNDGNSKYDFPICEGCGSILSNKDLLKLFPEKEEEIREASTFISKRR